MLAKLREQLAAEQFEMKFFAGISRGKRPFDPNHGIGIKCRKQSKR